MDEFLGKFDVSGDSTENFEGVGGELELDESVVVLLNLVGVSHADQKLLSNSVVVCNKVREFLRTHSNMKNHLLVILESFRKSFHFFLLKWNF